MTITPRLCEVCSSPLPTITGKGRPRTVCRDGDSPTPGTCRRYRDNRRDESRRDRRYYGSLYMPGAFPGEASVLPRGPSQEERLAAGGFHVMTPTGRAYIAHRRAHLNGLRRQEEIDAFERRLAFEERRSCVGCPILRSASPERVAHAVARRRARFA